ncbi:SanA/YdcF family protein [Lentiprolixibacter aurantiacus]|uniref:YdcF family protein n=1 Tax=Lentiprolixibacter aurantiacus TaxID=2993939 RepID=A0AAE3SN27_9FLAO|nr:ElyC/SanA/YdcF family protein [Lentiprolixibacter aurantiacus]MCX2719070.1 YdcF family protein [Lentiprolixibacter aurantiacus]
MRRKIRIAILLLIAMPLVVILLANVIIEQATKSKTYDTVADIPHNKVGLVLGTARRLVEGGLNPYYTHRIQATVDLFKAGKIQYVLVSGDNGSIYYNEPTTIKNDLVEAGIPEERIYLDYAGFRTLDSMVRAKVIFGLDSVTVISQEFHNKRAIYLARKKGLDAIGFNAGDVSGNPGLKVHLREYLARVKVFIDLILNTQPRYYGNRIEIQ